MSKLDIQFKNLSSFFTLKELSSITSRPDLLVNRMIKKDLVFALGNGYYAKKEMENFPMSYIHFRINNYYHYYFSYQSALEYYHLNHPNITNKDFTIAIYKNIANSKKIVINNNNLLINRISNKNKFFGYKKIENLQEKFIIANKEKTIIDCLDNMKLAGGYYNIYYALSKSIKKDLIDLDKLVNYAPLVSYSVVRRLGYMLTELKEYNAASILFENRGQSGAIYLAPKSDVINKIDKDWGVYVNV